LQHSENRLILGLFSQSLFAVPRTRAKQNEKPTATTSATAFQRKARKQIVFKHRDWRSSTSLRRESSLYAPANAIASDLTSRQRLSGAPSNTADFAVIKSKNSSRFERSCALAFTRKARLNESKRL
jgi:hypothetical protein